MRLRKLRNRRNRRCKKRSRSGMTIIEVMVVMVIMAMVAIAAGINVMKSLESARKNDTKTRARTLQSAAIALMLEDDSQGCPTVADLEARNVLDPTTEHTDAWGNTYEISCDETAVHVRSPGRDGELGNEDDIQLVTAHP